ncbi:MAG TPA: tetratricopeptide repeat-containing sensor histidine kinase [Ohtaekwangia sp.]|uniref:tetratricopeptide repeat-containing sensor histidine kinase n=1 Tax=Ohtaekwangia sp. TaxID=2066019 RepID=UPI002F931A1A
MNLRALVLLVCILVTFYLRQARGQKPERIDSLKRELHRATADTQRVKILFDISMKYWNFEPDSAMAYAVASLEKAKAIQYTKGHADALLHIGRLKRDQDNTAEALHEMFEALKLYRGMSDKVQIANALNDISIVYANSNDLEKSLEYFKQSLTIFQEMGDEKGESYALNNIGIIYQDLGNEAMAKEYFLKSLRIKEKNNDLYGISRGYSNLGSISENNKQWDEALLYYFKADTIFEKTKDLQGQSINFAAIARIKEKQGKLVEAIRFGIFALEKGKEVKALSAMAKASKLLALLEEKRSNYKTSLVYQKLYNDVADSLHNETNRANLEELKARFNLEEKEREIVLLKKDQELQQARLESRNIITYSLIAGIAMLSLVIGLLYYAFHTTRSKKNSLALKNEEIEKQKDDLDKLNKEKDRFFSILSHDLRSPLNSLKGFSYLLTEHVDSLTTEELMMMRTKIDNSLDNLTELINNILEWSMTSSHKRKWTFDKINTVALIQKNIALYHGMAESKGIKLLFNPTDEHYGYGDYYAIDTVVRNLLSNSIKFSHTNTEVYISVRSEENTLLISVKDQGVGIPYEIQEKLFTLNENVRQPGTNNEKGTGLGLTLCKELICENKGDIHVKSIPGEGSEFIVAIPEYTQYAESHTTTELHLNRY